MLNKSIFDLEIPFRPVLHKFCNTRELPKIHVLIGKREVASKSSNKVGLVLLTHYHTLNREDLEGFILKQWALAPD
jgi:hypothetical protein